MKYINYKEERNHGTIDFPIEFYHVTPAVAVGRGLLLCYHSLDF